MHQPEQVAEDGLELGVPVPVAHRNETQVHSLPGTYPGEGALQIGGFLQFGVIPYAEILPDLVPFPHMTVGRDVIIPGVLPGVDEATEVIALEGAKSPYAQDHISRRTEALEQYIAVNGREVVLPGLVHAPGEVHLVLVVDVQELQGGYERGLPNVVRAHQVQGDTQLHLSIVELT